MNGTARTDNNDSSPISELAGAFGKRWSWIQFGSAFALGGAVAFLAIDPISADLSFHLTRTILVATACGVVAGRFGDAAWRAIVRALPWV